MQEFRRTYPVSRSALQTDNQFELSLEDYSFSEHFLLRDCALSTTERNLQHSTNTEMGTDSTLTSVRSGPTGKLFVNGISNSYDERYSSELEHVLTREEHSEIVRRLNSTLATYWPCSPVYFTGYIMIPCTLGLSLLCPMMCVSEAEIHAKRLLENLSLKAKYYDRGVSFRLEKGYMTSSFIISFPSDQQQIDITEKSRLLDRNSGDIESNDPSTAFRILDEPGRARNKDV